MEFKWEDKKLSEIGYIVTGKTPSTKIEKNFGDRVPFLTPSDDMDARYVYETKRYLSDEGVNEVRKKLIPQNSICISCIGSQLGKVTITTEETVTNQQINSIVINDEYNIHFIYYLLLILGQKLNFLSKSSTAVPIINKKFFSEISVKVPQRQLQDKIAILLDSLDSKIEINNKIISNLESQAQAIFKSWFVDFEPFQDGDFVESELGMIPEGWEVKKVNEICDLKIGRTPPRKESEWFSLKEGVKWVSIKDLGLSQMYISEVTEYLTEESIEKFNIPIVEENTLLLSFKLTVGRIAITTEKMCTNEAIAQFKDPLISTLFLFYYFKNFKFETLGNTSSIGNAVNSKIIKNIEVLVPPEKIVLKVMKMIEPLSICIRNLLNQNTKLAELRDALLPKLMAGEIDVSNIKIEGEEVKNE